MSIYSTLYVTREKAEEMVRQCRLIGNRDDISKMSDEELDDELHSYVYGNEMSHKYDEAIGWAHNYIIKN